MATECNPFMNTSDDLFGLLAGLCSVFVLDLIKLALGFRQRFLVAAEGPWVLDELAIGEGREDFDANVNAHFRVRRFQVL
jgi:hypothetical protein